MPETLRYQAEQAAAAARSLAASGDPEGRLSELRKAVLLYAAADSGRETPEEPGPLTEPRAEACRLLGEALAESGRHAEAANIFQEATDLYGILPGKAASALTESCARRALASVAALKNDHRERLHLLIAHYERAQQQLALDPGTEARQAECCMHIARIYQRRDRPAESAERYFEALRLLDAVDDDPAVANTRAECHHRVANLLAGALDNPAAALSHFRSAIALYAQYEAPVHGTQQSLELCRSALARAESALEAERGVRDRERTRE